MHILYDKSYQCDTMKEKERVTITLGKMLLEKIDTTRELVPRSTYIEAVLSGKKEPFLEVS